MALKKDWTVYLIHHAHTDIGYTEAPGKTDAAIIATLLSRQLIFLMKFMRRVIHFMRVLSGSVKTFGRLKIFMRELMKFIKRNLSTMF